MKLQQSEDQHEFAADIEAVSQNIFVPTMLESVCLATGLRFAAIARVTEQRWITCSVVDHLDFGLRPGDELVVESTLCHEVRACSTEIVIDDALSDDTYREHATPRQYGFRSYISVPIFRTDGSFFGTLCALDPEPKRLNEVRVLEMVRLFARLIGDTLEAVEVVHQTQHDLEQERHLAEVQEEFMAILAHDLRNPLSAIRSGLRMLGTGGAVARHPELITLMGAAAQRMTGLINNLLDHARNRLGDGIVLNCNSEGCLAEALGQIIAEFRTIAPDQRIQATIDIPQALHCDRARVAQLLSNLLGNAITHDAEGRPIEVTAQVTDSRFILSVRNEGTPIPQDRLPQLFLPFRKGDGRPRHEGLGLGLYIAAEIARAHEGEMAVKSDANGTVFTFRMPVSRQLA